MPATLRVLAHSVMPRLWLGCLLLLLCTACVAVNTLVQPLGQAGRLHRAAGCATRLMPWCLCAQAASPDTPNFLSEADVQDDKPLNAICVIVMEGPTSASSPIPMERDEFFREVANAFLGPKASQAWH